MPVTGIYADPAIGKNKELPGNGQLKVTAEHHIGRRPHFARSQIALKILFPVFGVQEAKIKMVIVGSDTHPSCVTVPRKAVRLHGARGGIDGGGPVQPSGHKAQPELTGVNLRTGTQHRMPGQGIGRKGDVPVTGM
ncbi:hypothetical protein FQZ97_795890 [compost metagenome]